MDDTPGPITILIRRVQQGDEDARNELWEKLYPILRRKASALLNQDDVRAVARPSDILQGAFIQLLAREKVGWNDSKHLMNFAVRVMRNLITDLARTQLKHARAHVAWDDAPDIVINNDINLLEINEALNQLEEVNPEAVKVVELRFYGGLGNEEIADNLDISISTVKRRIDFAKGFIMSR